MNRGKSASAERTRCWNLGKDVAANCEPPDSCGQNSGTVSRQRNGGAEGPPSFGYFSWRSKKSNQQPGCPRHNLVGNELPTLRLVMVLYVMSKNPSTQPVRRGHLKTLDLHFAETLESRFYVAFPEEWPTPLLLFLEVERLLLQERL